MLAEGMSHASADAQARALREQQVELSQLLESVQSAIDSDGDLLESYERTQVDEVMQAGRIVLDDASANADTVRQAVERLSQVTAPFAARRMDRSIRRALSGRSLDEVSKT
jgi:molecular chaperone HscA